MVSRDDIGCCGGTLCFLDENVLCFMQSQNSNLHAGNTEVDLTARWKQHCLPPMDVLFSLPYELFTRNIDDEGEGRLLQVLKALFLEESSPKYLIQWCFGGVLDNKIDFMKNKKRMTGCHQTGSPGERRWSSPLFVLGVWNSYTRTADHFKCSVLVRMPFFFLHQ